MGFYTTRYVEADDSEEAAKRAKELVCDEVRKLIVNQRDQPWDVMVEKIKLTPESDASASNENARFGFSWFPEDAPENKT